MDFDDNIPTDPALLELEALENGYHIEELPSISFSDDAEALNLVEEERVRKLIADRQVIHQPNLDRIPEFRGTWRSSSLPPPGMYTSLYLKSLANCCARFADSCLP